MNKNVSLSIFGIGLSILVAAGWYAYPKDQTIATFNGGSITKSELDESLEAEFGQEMLQELITRRLIDKAVADNHLAISDVELSLWMEDYQQRPDVQEIIAAGQLNKEKLRENLRTSVPLYYLALKDISEQERETYFETHRSNFEQLELSHILLGSQEEALQLRQRITGPESFATMAIVHSLDDRNRDFSGSLGKVTRAELESSFSAEDVSSLFKMQPGTVSRPMVSQSGGWHLFLVKKRTTDYQQLKRQVVAQMAEPKLSSCLEKLRNDGQVQVLWTSPTPEITNSQTSTSPSPVPSSKPSESPKVKKAEGTVPVKNIGSTQSEHTYNSNNSPNSSSTKTTAHIQS